jgi:chromosome segregation ATPase
MSAIEQAQARLDAALERLEQALATRRGDDDPSTDAPLAAEVEGLRSECESLRERLNEAETRHAKLKSAMAAMGSRLDAAIGELDGLIEAKAAE